MFLVLDFKLAFSGCSDHLHKEEEYPPSWARIYSALINASYEKQRATGENLNKDFFIWLEKQIPIKIHYNEPSKNRMVQYVYNSLINRESSEAYAPKMHLNFEGKHLILEEVSNKSALPKNRITQTPTGKIYYEFSDHQNWEKLNDILPWVIYIGKSSDLVKITIENERDETEKTFIHTNEGKGKVKKIRSTHEGYFNLLEKQNETGTIDQNKLHFENYVDSNKYVQDNKNILSFDTYLINGDLSVYDTEILGGNLRNEIAKRGSLELQDFVFGKKDKRNGSTNICFVPLSHVFGKYKDLQTKGFGVLIPQEAKLFKQEIDRIIYQLANTKQKLYDNIIVSNEKSHIDTLNPFTYEKSSKRWTTITPVIMLYEKDIKKKEKWILEECQRCGYPAPVKVEFQNSYFHLKSKEFYQNSWYNKKKLEGKDKGSFKGFYSFMNLEFDRFVKGPILIGRGKTFGMGLFYPCK